MNRKRLSTLAILALCVASLAPAAFAQQQPQQQPAAAQTPARKETPPEGGKPRPFTLPKRETFKLSNGMRVTLVPYGSIPKVTVRAVVRTGNIDDPAGKVWLADVAGDLMKEGTATRTAQQIAEDAARMGGSLNVGVGEEQTSVGLDVLSEFGPEAAALVADVLQRPLLPASELERIKTNRLRSVTISRSQPGPTALERFRKALYGDHPFGHLYPEEAALKGYTAEDVKKFYADNFGAQRTHVFVVGQFDAAAMRRAVAREFEKWAKGAPATQNPPKPASARAIHLINRPGAAQSTIYLGLPVVDPSHADYVPLVVTDYLLGGAFTSRVTSNIRENKGYTYSPYSQVSTRFRDAYWVQIADVTTAVTGPSLKEIFYEIDELQKNPPTAAELQGIKNNLAGIFAIQNSSRGGIINQLAFLDLHGLPDTYLTNYVQNILNVTPADVQRAAKTYLRPDRMTIVVVGDREKIDEQIKPYGQPVNN
ncbi:MAG TPA: pitrilysin family protein [Pyrinomonadaceae bacterium]|nr:pitrilysin family protein [Pyrinomonadaceae bacterium]